MQNLNVKFKSLTNGMGLPLPSYAKPGDSGMDVRAAGNVTIEPLCSALVPCGFAMAVPEGYEAQVRPRSGLALKHEVSILNAPATIDSGYNGEIRVLLINHGERPFNVNVGDRIAQLVFAPVVRAVLEEVDELPESERGDGGFGHTGVA